MSCHTPGPWTYDGDIYIYGADWPEQGYVAQINPHRSNGLCEPDADANARLIASAPALVEALRETLRALEAHLDDDTVHANLSHRDHLCPCNQNEVARAKALLATIDGKAAE